MLVMAGPMSGLEGRVEGFDVGEDGRGVLSALDERRPSVPARRPMYDRPERALPSERAESAGDGGLRSGSWMSGRGSRQ